MDVQLLTKVKTMSGAPSKVETEEGSSLPPVHHTISTRGKKSIFSVKEIGRRLGFWQIQLLGLIALIAIITTVRARLRRDLIPSLKEAPEVAIPRFKGWEALPAIKNYEQKLSDEEKRGKQFLAKALFRCLKEAQPSGQARQQLQAVARVVTGDKEDQLLGLSIKLADITRFKETDKGSAPPASAGEFRVTRLLGEGSSSVVLELLHEPTNERFAMKILVMATADPENYMELLKAGGLELIENEEKSMLKIVGSTDAEYTAIHRGLAVPLYTATLAEVPKTVSSGNLCVFSNVHLMEVLYSDMGKILTNANRRLPEEAVAYIAKRLLLQVLHLHAFGVTHNDLTWKNLLMRADGSFLLGDFGSSCVAGETMPVLTGPNSIYAEPSLLIDHYNDDDKWEPLKPDPKGDLWSLGVMLYELFTGGTLPYNMSAYLDSEEVRVEHLSNLLKGESSPADLFADSNRGENINPRWKELLCRLLEPDREKRISDLEVLQMFPDIVGSSDN